MRALWKHVAIGWCRAFHPEPFWPIHGHYCCRTCMRSYPVPWREGDEFRKRQHSTTVVLSLTGGVS